MSDKEGAPIRLWRPMPRRRFVQGSVAATGGLAVGIAGPLGVGAQDLPGGTPVATPIPVDAGTPAASPVAGEGLTDRELATLQAAIERLIPPDDLGPGAVDAGVDVYINQSLMTVNAAVLPAYQGGLAALDAAAGSDGFAAADAAAQDAILTDAEGGELANAPEGFFPMLLEHTRQGMFSDPIHGGNKDFAGWDLIGYPGIKLIWTAEDQAINAEPAPAHISVEEYGGTAS